MPAVSRTSLKDEDSGVRKLGKLDPARIPSAAFSASTKLSLTIYISSSVLSHYKTLKSVTGMLIKPGFKMSPAQVAQLC